MAITVVHEFACDRPDCNATDRVERPHHWGEDVPRPAAPPHWTLVNGLLYCTRHRVRVRVDDDTGGVMPHLEDL